MSATEQTGRWTDQEHDLFIQAVALYGRKWIRVAEHVGTRTTIQVRSHAQKFEAKNGGRAGLASLMEKRRQEMAEDADADAETAMTPADRNQRSYSCPTRLDSDLDHERTPSWTSVAQFDTGHAQWGGASDLSAGGAMGYDMATPPRHQPVACLTEEEFSSSQPASWADAQSAAMMLADEADSSDLAGPVVYQDSRGMGMSGMVDSSIQGARVCRRRSSTLLDELMDFIEDDVQLDPLQEVRGSAMDFAMEEDL